MNNDRIVIIGAGVAGAATAYFVTRKGLRNVVLLEREKVAGAQSTGRNAAILRTMIPDPLLNRLACQSAEFYHHPPAGFSSEPLVDCVGVYLAAGAEHVSTLKGWCDDNPEAGVQQGDASEMYKKVPPLAPGLQAVAYKPDDGVLDVHSILQGFLRGASKAGAELRLGCEFNTLRTRNSWSRKQRRFHRSVQGCGRKRRLGLYPQYIQRLFAPFCTISAAPGCNRASCPGKSALARDLDRRRRILLPAGEWWLAYVRL
jgi:glycine/D-amino acid oxidase-like deaminating enzyme